MTYRKHQVVTIYRKTYSSEGGGSFAKAYYEQGTARGHIWPSREVEEMSGGQWQVRITHRGRFHRNADIQVSDVLLTRNSKELRVIAIKFPTDGRTLEIYAEEISIENEGMELV